MAHWIIWDRDENTVAGMSGAFPDEETANAWLYGAENAEGLRKTGYAERFVNAGQLAHDFVLVEIPEPKVAKTSASSKKSGVQEGSASTPAKEKADAKETHR